ncbi:hypothetical protein MIND_00350300 [Mycena indigotica]|uniref:Receptor-activated Ca2+-permeable cation channel n=1 Tax=Mycena indigotica TaxID=2126181 RepID=A0A8H6T2N1_9AGAR|nr:uncharacterized protein MIND_00350300 [Mycena indigotica]KAF7309784.1 hypothetical protein MIND_00350300 [Mycena indigotica]
MIKKHYIDTPLTYAALTAPDLTYTLIHPLLEKYCTLQRAHSNLSVVFCLLLNRVHFFRDENISTTAMSSPIECLGNSMMDLTVLLTTSWPIYAGAGPEVIAHGRSEFIDFDPEERVGNAIEMAIVGKAKRFLKSSSCQKVIDGIWAGRYVYQAESSHSILSDTYKRTPVHFYDPHKAPLLDHYRLKVPAVRSVLEYSNFLILFVLFIFAIELSELNRINAAELIFMIYALGFTLEKIAAMQEHGIKVYFKGTWNGFDMVFVATYCVYAFLRMYGIYHDHAWARSMGVDLMALIACLLFPRLAFVTLKNNLMVLSLRAMILQFCLLMIIAAFCFCGFLYALWTLSRNQAGYSISQIAWWMLDLWFGLDATGFDRSTKFHPVFGPILVRDGYLCVHEQYAATYWYGLFILSRHVTDNYQFSFLCVLTSFALFVLEQSQILSNTFATISEDAHAEAMFRKAVSTIEGVKADSLFSYQPPINLLALCIMLPASYILSPSFQVNVFMIRLTSFPILLLITLYERQAKKNGTTNIYETITVITERVVETLPRRFKIFNFFEGLAGSDHDIDAVFEIEDELMASALAVEETSATEDLFKLHAQRRSSPYSSPSRPTPPAQPHSTPLPITSPTPPPPASSSSPPNRPNPILGPRARVASLMHRGTEVAQTFTSPLAQIFQPLVVDDGGIPEEITKPDLPSQNRVQLTPEHRPANGAVVPPPPAGVSYGPAYRRRLSSMHAREGSSGGQVGHVRRASEAPRMLFPTSENDDVFSESPDDRDSALPTAEDVEEKKDVWIQRLDKMETRQERIEELLEKILRTLNKEDD